MERGGYVDISTHPRVRGSAVAGLGTGLLLGPRVLDTGNIAGTLHPTQGKPFRLQMDFLFGRQATP
jgi:hypothetical protein